jgi:hypothetical protein
MGGEEARRAGRREGAERVIYNSQEWRDKIEAARGYAGRRNKKMAIIAHRVNYRDRLSWHYVIMTADMARATGHLRRDMKWGPQ